MHQSKDTISSTQSVDQSFPRAEQQISGPQTQYNVPFIESHTNVDRGSKPPALANPPEAQEPTLNVQGFATDSKTVILISGADMEAVPIDWLWKNWLALGKLHILAGDPGTGKTTIAMSLGATVSSGANWPDGSQNSIGRVLIWSGEDDYEDTLLPRLLAAGADRERISFVAQSRENGRLRPFDPSRDITSLQQKIAGLNDIRLIIIDPIASAIAGDSHKNSETRRDLQPLVDLATASNATVIGITHLSKAGGGTDPITRVLGSVAFTALPRVVLLASKYKDHDGADSHIMVRAKSNIGADGGGFDYSITEVEPIQGINTNTIIWNDYIHGSARELLSVDQSNGREYPRRETAVSSAVAALESILLNGPKYSNTVYDKMKSLGFAEKTIRRAHTMRGIISTKSKGDGRWVLTLPPNLATSQTEQNLAKLDSLTNKDSFMENTDFFNAQ